MLAFSAVAAWRWSQSGLIFFVLTGFRDLLAAWFLLIRTPNQLARHNKSISVLAYASSALPLMYLSPSAITSPIAETIATCLAIVGYALATLALIELGPSFGISAANRGKKHTGVYRYVRHPMYAGYLISELGFVLLNPSNVITFTISTVSYYMRGKVEIQSLTIHAQ
jgi:protein-S-isoprenylcysteine O-methyltransferase Ste14